jgi:PAS domain S-box-containing protein
MNAYVLLVLSACVASAVCATAIWSRDPAHRANRLAAALIYGGGFWAFCEVPWNTATTPGAALAWVKLSALGWVGIGPLALHLLLEVTSHDAPRLRALLPALYGASAFFLAIDWLTPWIHPSVRPTSWGWTYALGPMWPPFYALTVAQLGLALGIGWRVYHHSPSPAERHQIRWLAAGITIPLVVASLTDGVLPFLGIQVPHLGTTAFALLGMTVAGSLYRFGYSLLAPGHFALEIVETMRDGLALLHLDGRLRSANASLARLTGCERQDLIGAPARELWSVDLLAPAREVHDLECELRPLRGQPFPVALSSAHLRDRQGYTTGLAVVVRDLREVVALRRRLLVSARMAAVGQLAGGVAHEINNPMAYVRANLSRLRDHFLKLSRRDGAPPGPGDWRELAGEGADLIEESLDGVERTTAIVRDIVGFSRAGDGQRVRVDLRALLDSVQRIASAQLGEGTRIERQDAELPRVSCAPREIEHVFLNLLLNAIEAVEGSGTVRIVSACRDDAVEVRVEDDGRGIAPAELERIFDPFFTTKSVGESTGFGLALCYEVVRRHGGDIHVASEPGRGSSFRVTLPIEPT